MRSKLAKHRKKIAELEAVAVEMEQEIKQAEEEQLAYLARSAANTLSGGMDEVFELLRSLRVKPNQGVTVVTPETSDIPNTFNDHNFHESQENKEGEAFDGTGETQQNEV